MPKPKRSVVVQNILCVYCDKSYPLLEGLLKSHTAFGGITCPGSGLTSERTAELQAVRAAKAVKPKHKPKKR